MIYITAGHTDNRIEHKAKMKKRALLAITTWALAAVALAGTPFASNATPAAFTAYDVSRTSTGVLFTLKFDSSSDRYYSIARGENLISNDWNLIAADLPGTGSNMFYSDLIPPAARARFYKASSIAAPSANILLNGDFETGTPTADRSATFDAPPWKWFNLNTNNNSWLTDASFDPIIGSGNQALEFCWGGTYIYQDFPAMVGRTYLLSVDALNSGNATNGLAAQLQVEWYDATSTMIGSRILLDAANNSTDPLGIWFELRGNAIAPANAVTGRIILICSKTGTAKNYFFDNASVSAEPIGDGAAVTAAWPYGGSNPATLVAVSQAAGLYAVAERVSDRIEIRDIRGTNIATVTSAMLQAAATNLNLSGSVGGPCSLAFTPSGRLLYIGVCSASGGTNKDAVLLFNLNLGTLTVFDRLVIDGGLTGANFGMAHYKGQLFVGTDTGLNRYAAGRNDTGNRPLETIAVGAPVTGLAVDMTERTGTNWTAKLYVSTPSSIYRVNPAVSLSLGSAIASGSNIKGLAFGRAYGGLANGGLYVLENNGATATLRFASTASVRGGGSASLQTYKTFGADLAGIAATACGRMLLATTSPQIMSDTADTRMSFEAWLQDEFNNYALAVKSLAWPNGLVPEGFNTSKLVPAGDTFQTGIDVDTSGWVLYCLLADHLVNGDPEAEGMIAKILKRNAGAYPDGLGGVKTIDGILTDTYNTNGTPTGDPGTLYTMMKLLPAAYRAKATFPANAEIAGYQEYFRSIMKRSSDTIRPNYALTWKNDDYGPLDINNGSVNESWIMVDLAAAQDPFAKSDYEDYLYDRNDIPYWDYFLTNEPVIKSDHSAFINMGGSMILRNHRDMPGWDEQNRNYYAISMAAGDDMGAPYFTAFSAGNNTWVDGNYNADDPASHPGDIIHFPAVCGFGQYGWTSPAVGAYLAYRDGLRQEMQSSGTYSNSRILTRCSMDDPTYAMAGIGIADLWFGMIGLGELLHPGLTDFLADDYFMPAPTQTLTTNNLVQLDYSKITPRHVLGSNDGTNWISHGFQLSPFVFGYGESYAQYRVTDPEGELLVVTNGNFENGISGWTTNGDYLFSSVATAGVSIVGTSAQIRSTASTTSSNSSLSQTLNVSLDLDNTRYILRADGRSVFAGPAGLAYLRIEWDADANPTNGILGSQQSNQLTNSNARVEYRIDAAKPSGANYLRIYLVVEQVQPTDKRYIFDNISLVRLGAAAALPNGGFEYGNTTGWTNNNPVQIKLTSVPAKVLEGTNAIQYLIGPGVTAWKRLDRTIDVSGDPLGTRYIFRLDAKAITMVDSDFQIQAQIYDSQGALIIERDDLGDILPTTSGEVVFTLRKRPGYDHILLRFEMRRNSAASPGTDEVIIDNLRMDKERLF